MSEAEELVKIRAAIPANEDAGDGVPGGEIFWAKPLGDWLYEIRNIVVYVRGLHPLDVVRCAEEAGNLPTVVEVVRASGYKTVGVIFREDTGATLDQHVDVMWALRQKGITSEKVENLTFVLAVSPEVNYQETADFLRNQEEQEILYFYELE